MINVGLIGFGLAGRSFHAPVINAVPGLNLAAILQRTGSQAAAAYPNARIVLLSGFVEPLGLTEENTGADTVIAKSANEPGHLTRAVKRLVNAGKRKPVSSQKGGKRSRAATR